MIEHGLMLYEATFIEIDGIQRCSHNCAGYINRHECCIPKCRYFGKLTPVGAKDVSRPQCCKDAGECHSALQTTMCNLDNIMEVIHQ